MNTKLLVVLALLCAAVMPAKAQGNYIPLPDSAGVWVNAVYSYYLQNGVPVYNLVRAPAYCTNGSDTTINSMQYSKLLHCNSGSYKGALRQSAGVVYYVPGDSLQEYLLLDFNVTSAGDTLFNVYWEDGYSDIGQTSTLYIGPNNIDSVLIGTRYHKRIFAGASHWIEGIGNTAGLLAMTEPNISNMWLTLDCMSDKDTVKFANQNITYSPGQCDLALGKTAMTVSEKIELFPNPASEHVTIRLSEKSNGHLQVFNASGVLMTKQSFNDGSQIDLDIKCLPAGIYVVLVQNGEGTIARRFIRE